MESEVFVIDLTVIDYSGHIGIVQSQSDEVGCDSGSADSSNLIVGDHQQVAVFVKDELCLRLRIGSGHGDCTGLVAFAIDCDAAHSLVSCDRCEAVEIIDTLFRIELVSLGQHRSVILLLSLDSAELTIVDVTGVQSGVDCELIADSEFLSLGHAVHTNYGNDSLIAYGSFGTLFCGLLCDLFSRLFCNLFCGLFGNLFCGLFGNLFCGLLSNLFCGLFGDLFSTFGLIIGMIERRVESEISV